MFTGEGPGEVDSRARGRPEDLPGQSHTPGSGGQQAHTNRLPHSQPQFWTELTSRCHATQQMIDYNHLIGFLSYSVGAFVHLGTIRKCVHTSIDTQPYWCLVLPVLWSCRNNRKPNILCVSDSIPFICFR